MRRSNCEDMQIWPKATKKSISRDICISTERISIPLIYLQITVQNSLRYRQRILVRISVVVSSNGSFTNFDMSDCAVEG